MVPLCAGGGEGLRARLIPCNNKKVQGLNVDLILFILTNPQTPELEKGDLGLVLEVGARERGHTTGTEGQCQMFGLEVLLKHLGSQLLRNSRLW